MSAVTETSNCGQTSQAIRERLARRREFLLSDIRAHLREALHVTEESDPGTGDLERATEAAHEEELALNIADVERDSDELSAIKSALDALQAGTYGLCLDCGEAIGARRLSLNPAATRCLACASEREHMAAAASRRR